jgi:formamidopyrimidine-DNA glycosylase
MPELPEVEVLRRSLESLLVGQRINSVEVRNAALREPVDLPSLRQATVGRRIRGLRRRAKYLLVDLAGDSTLVIHLGMSGALTVAAADVPRELHEHLSFGLRGGKRLRFRDSRRFGLVFVVPTRKLEGDRHFCHLGAEPLGEELAGEWLRERARDRSCPVKSFLMNGRIVVGIGNIYASEALYLARIHPRRSVARISLARWSRLAGAVRETLLAAIDQGGTSLADFTDGQGRDGNFQVSLRVYGRSGEPCPVCGATIRRIVQTGRSTFYCPRCQR